MNSLPQLASDEGHVIEIGQIGRYRFAVLYDFKVDEHHLRQAHVDWLTETFFADSNSRVHVWVTGMASRTASHAYNLALSRRRAAAVIDVLKTRLDSRVKLTPFTLGLGELVAQVRGIADGVEKKDDRAVLVAWRISDTLPPPPPPRPIPPNKVGFYRWDIRLVKFQYDQGSSLAYKAIPGVETNAVRAHFQIKRTPGNHTFEYVFDVDEGLSISGPDPFPPMAPICGSQSKSKACRSLFGRPFPPSKWIPFDWGISARPPWNPINDTRCVLRTPDLYGDIELRFGGPKTRADWKLTKLPWTRAVVRTNYVAEFDYRAKGDDPHYFVGDLVRKR